MICLYSRRIRGPFSSVEQVHVSYDQTYGDLGTSGLTDALPLLELACAVRSSASSSSYAARERLTREADGMLLLYSVCAGRWLLVKKRAFKS